MWILVLIFSLLIFVASLSYFTYVIVSDRNRNKQRIKQYRPMIKKEKHALNALKNKKNTFSNTTLYYEQKNNIKDSLFCDKNDLGLAREHSNLSYIFVNDGRIIAPFLSMVVFICFAFGSAWSGYRDYHIIPQQRTMLTYKAENMKHYKVAMNYNRADERAERHSNAKFTGNLGKPKDNKTWQTNYYKYFMAKGWKHFYKVEIQYEKHPLHHLNDYFYLHTAKRTGNPTDLR